MRAERGLRAHRAGLASERLSAWFLRCKGYRILHRRYKTPVGEIDIVARRGGTLVFVEVKSRPQAAAAAEAVTPQTVARMRRATDHYLRRYSGRQPVSLRLDVMLVTSRRPWLIHIRNAFGDGQLAGHWS